MRNRQRREVDSRSNALHERDFGIYEFVRPKVMGLGGRVKSMYSDFIVREVNQEGLIVDLHRATQLTRRATDWQSTADDTSDGDENEYVRFVVHKANLETYGSIQSLSETLDIPRNALSYCGLKDCCAITTQEMSVHKVVSCIANHSYRACRGMPNPLALSLSTG
jgi:tRNA(Glu) U13 pseudouridine synthase TruD